MSYLLIVRLPNLVATSDNFSAYTQLGISFIAKPTVTENALNSLTDKNMNLLQPASS